MEPDRWKSAENHDDQLAQHEQHERHGRDGDEAFLAAAAALAASPLGAPPTGGAPFLAAAGRHLGRRPQQLCAATLRQTL